MSLKVKYEKKQHELPEEGTHRATLIKVEELGIVETNYGPKEKLNFIWELAGVLNSQGKPFQIHQRFTKSLSPKANLFRVIIEGDEVGSEYDVETLVGKQVNLMLKHNSSEDGLVYANVAAILRPKSKAEEASENRVARALSKTRDRATATPVSRRSLHGTQSGHTP